MEKKQGQKKNEKVYNTENVDGLFILYELSFIQLINQKENLKDNVYAHQRNK